jgi:hypothetical protein
VPRWVGKPIYELLNGRQFADLPVNQAAPLMSTLAALQWLRSGVILLVLIGPAIAANSLPSGYIVLGQTVVFTLILITPGYYVALALVASGLRRLAARDPSSPVSRHPGILRGLLAAPYVGAVIALVVAAGVAA